MNLSADRTSRRSTFLWLIPLVALAAYGGYLTDFGKKLFGDDVEWRNVKAATTTSAVVPDIAFNADASPYSAITDRNLFAPWRKPAPPPEAAKPPPEPPKPQIRRGIYALTGTMQIGDGVVATVKENATNRSKQVKLGDQLQEYTVKAVENDRIVLAYAGQEEELVLARYTQSGRATPPPQIAVAQPQIAPQIPGQPPMPVPPPQPGQPQGAARVGGAAVSGGLQPFPPSGTGPGFGPQPTPVAPAQAVSAVPVAQQPAPEIIDVGELLRRRREARKQ